ncbi:DUF221-domain-containing protein [Coprinellus micaceus]|uniref:DUF221-domain-containing protein n=1 Tax=Coprinellus micaceus TaxID=71717 RepID=A0A4Y7SJH9_COPMI|nr:DUF221-domain-containing protein [Coprinellus micaceus]
MFEDEPGCLRARHPCVQKFEGPWFTTQLTLTKLKGFSPHEAHAHQAFFGWIMPTIRTSEFTVLQIVGLDAAVLLNFFKMSFYLFSGDWPLLLSSRSTLNAGDTPTNHTKPPDWLDLISDANSYLSVHLVFTYLFTVLALYFTYKNYRRFIKSRQLFSLELYFENMGMAVESVTICRDVGSLKALLDLRTTALLALERAWTDYVGNPSTVEEYDPVNDAESGQSRLVVPHRPRPTIRTSWLKGKVDALEYLEEQFRRADEAVKERRRKGKFRAAGSAFVTFEKMSSAQIAVQVAHASNPYQLHTHPAPEPRDIVWANMVPSTNNIRARDVLVLALMGFLLFTWIFPISALASLLSYKEIQKVMPWLSKMIDSNEQVRAIVQNSLPSVAMITLNALLPFMLEALTYLQGYRARSWVEYSLLKKYFLFLLINVVFIFLLASTYWQLVRDLANSPAKVPEKLAQALQAGRARHFFLSYVILQGLGIMPLQLLNLGVIIPRAVSLIFFTRTPRDFAELNAPPMINYGVVYPQAILMFVITMLYSVVQPLIVIFGAIYFGVAYVVYKYKLLFVFYKPYESQGQAWPITFIRLVWGVLIFLLFMIGIFGLRKSYILSSLLVPLLVGTGFWAWYVDASLRPLSQFVSLSSETADVTRLRAGHPVTWSQSNLNRRRYAQNDDTLYVAPEDERTDYSQPPMANWYSGVLNTGKRRYGHPALNGQSLVNQSHRDPNRAHAAEDGGDAVVLTLRKRHSRPFGGQRRGSSSRGPRARDSSATLTNANGNGVNGLDQSMTESMMSLGEASTGTDGERPVGEGSPLNTGRQSRYGTYFHHPERRRQQIPGAFPR